MAKKTPLQKIIEFDSIGRYESGKATANPFLAYGNAVNASFDAIHRSVMDVIDVKKGLRDDCSKAVTGVLVALIQEIHARPVKRKHTVEKDAAKKISGALSKIAKRAKELPPRMRRRFQLDVEKLRLQVSEISSAKAPPKSKVDDAEEKRSAAREALQLIKDFSKVPPSLKTSDSEFCKLAAVLYGDPNADLHHQCEAAMWPRKTVRQRKRQGQK